VRFHEESDDPNLADIKEKNGYLVKKYLKNVIFGENGYENCVIFVRKYL